MDIFYRTAVNSRLFIRTLPYIEVV